MQAAMVRLSQLTLAPGEDRLAVQANVTLTSRNWLNAFQRALSSNDASTWNSLFAPDSWLKDNLVFRWDSATVEGASSIRDYIQRNGPKLSNLQLSKSRNFQPTLVERGPLVWIEAGFDFDTEIGSGRGIVRLANTKTGVWSAWIVYVALQELKSHPRKSLRSPDYFLASPKRVPDARAMEDEPSVLIIGGGKCSLCPQRQWDSMLTTPQPALG
jgi:hypothetical protein